MQPVDYSNSQSVWRHSNKVKFKIQLHTGQFNYFIIKANSVAGEGKSVG